MQSINCSNCIDNDGKLSIDICVSAFASLLGWGEFEEAEAISSVGVSVYHDVARVGVIAQPLPSVVTVLGHHHYNHYHHHHYHHHHHLRPVEVLIELVPGGADHHQVAAPRVAAPPRPCPRPWQTNIFT